MRIALLYPPPWKIAEPGELADPEDGPPEDYRVGDLDADFHQTPYGLYSLAAQALRAGQSVKLFNLSAHSWQRVSQVVDALEADVYGMSCWTANRRGVVLVARLIRTRWPNARIVVGGPHVTPLGVEFMEHYPEIDCAVLGEGELTWLELLGQIERGLPLTGIAGTVYRDDGVVKQGPPRAAIHDLDGLDSPHEHFTTHIFMTSRGCPWQCTFCGAEASWGRGFRGQSVGYVLDALEKAVERLPVKMLQIKDDTFTTNRKRVAELCRGIRQRGLNFLWSCDTRVDVLSEQLLYEMRLAGCQRLSLGVESGSAEILKNIDKRITVDEIVASAEMAKRYGIQVRFFMMLGNRGETGETFQETLRFLDRAKPHQFIFSCLSVYPGTLDFEALEKSGSVTKEAYFSGKFQELKVPFDASASDSELMLTWFRRNAGVQNHYFESIEECRQALERLGDHHAAHLDLAGAYYAAGDLDSAERHTLRALELDLPVPGLADNYLACIAHAKGNVKGMMDFFMRGARRDPQHAVLIKNVQRARQWFKDKGPERGLSLELAASHRFELLERTLQPALPGPLSQDYAVWPASSGVAVADSVSGLAGLAKTEPQGPRRKLLNVV